MASGATQVDAAGTIVNEEVDDSQLQLGLTAGIRQPFFREKLRFIVSGHADFVDQQSETTFDTASESSDSSLSTAVYAIGLEGALANVTFDVAWLSGVRSAVSLSCSDCRPAAQERRARSGWSSPRRCRVGRQLGGSLLALAPLLGCSGYAAYLGPRQRGTRSGAGRGILHAASIGLSHGQDARRPRSCRRSVGGHRAVASGSSRAFFASSPSIGRSYLYMNHPWTPSLAAIRCRSRAVSSTRRIWRSSILDRRRPLYSPRIFQRRGNPAAILAALAALHARTREADSSSFDVFFTVPNLRYRDYRPFDVPTSAPKAPDLAPDRRPPPRPPFARPCSANRSTRACRESPRRPALSR